MDDRELANRLDKIESGITLLIQTLVQTPEAEDERKRGFESRREE